ncbi:hypothetical protein M501DRAFT_983738 [Patellaria atrata CBS 101060]|uniref:Genetic interactor of prohibitins 3, mitochondrial n=1 Tax=Patellaria atrata CBS 101060 TaxID=1346257 RepID=A0A9P4VKM3_9PEZI|nr:hypothetical protein M501DRAFT_983738 [Patellaria atrata CBS 101060]
MKRAVHRASLVSRADLDILYYSIPTFLCPTLLRESFTSRRFRRNVQCIPRQRFSTSKKSFTETVIINQVDTISLASDISICSLPIACPGCGALSQTVEPDEAGHYSMSRGAVASYLRPKKRIDTSEDKIFAASVQSLHEGLRKQLGLVETPQEILEENSPTPVCDRCHNLIHHHAGVPIHHPTIQSIEDTIAESPYKHNHIYHVLDAADLPMSLIPNLTRQLDLAPLRTQNRRSKHRTFFNGRVADVSFIITRSDLLAPKKEQVDSLMPYLLEVLRDALGRTGRNVRLGNVRCVSSKRGWWTKEVKEDVWKRGGGGWMVGKVNVGKSNLFEVVFPKGRMHDISIDKVRSETGNNLMLKPLSGDDPHALSFGGSTDIDLNLPSVMADLGTPNQATSASDSEETSSLLLPPARPETPYPHMPTISSLPGTTASPIRIPFGSGRGELIDLPGLARSTLDTYVDPEFRSFLVMKSRVVPERLTLKPGQSLLLGGGLVRITPVTQDLVFIVHGFVPLAPHITATEKAVGIQTGERESGVKSVMAEEARKVVRSAGVFDLWWDVTRAQAGPLTRPEAAGIKVENLPFRVYGADLLVEGVGWVEVMAQARKPKRRVLLPEQAAEKELRDMSSDQGRRENRDSTSFKPIDEIRDEQNLPQIEVFTPEGKFIGIRRPMNASLLGCKKPKPKNERKKRPRMSMKSAKAHRKPGTE